MLKTIIPIVVILNLALLSPCSGIQAAYKGQPPPAGASAAAEAPSSDMKVINVVVDKIDDEAIYSKDGRKFEIAASTRIINDSHSGAKIRIAELVFRDGSLVEVVLK